MSIVSQHSNISKVISTLPYQVRWSFTKRRPEMQILINGEVAEEDGEGTLESCAGMAAAEKRMATVRLAQLFALPWRMGSNIITTFDPSMLARTENIRYLFQPASTSCRMEHRRL
jgi:hypothetical protein